MPKDVWAVVEQSEKSEDFSMRERKTNDSRDPRLTVYGVRLRCRKSKNRRNGGPRVTLPSSMLGIYVDYSDIRGIAAKRIERKADCSKGVCSVSE